MSDVMTGQPGLDESTELSARDGMTMQSEPGETMRQSEPGRAAGQPAQGVISLEDYLEQYGTLTYTNVGISMLPLLRQGKDLFTVEKKGNERCKAGDVVLYRRPPDAYVLHRVIQVRAEDYVILGDNCINKEYGITDEDIIGVMTGFVRGGKEHHVTDTGYRIYSSIWMHTAGFRVFLKKCRYYAGRVKRRLF